MYVTGWSLRRFAYHLEETLKHDLVDDALQGRRQRAPSCPSSTCSSSPGPKVYGAPVTPIVNAEALQSLDLAAKTDATSVFHQQIEITGRGYGLAARRAPKMGADIGVAVLRSEI